MQITVATPASDNNYPIGKRSLVLENETSTLMIVVFLSPVPKKCDYKLPTLFNIVGFQGHLVLNTRSLEPEEQFFIWQLAVYGSLMGFGYKTAWGLGQTS